MSCECGGDCGPTALFPDSKMSGGVLRRQEQRGTLVVVLVILLLVAVLSVGFNIYRAETQIH